MDIIAAKKELYENLKQNAAVNGAGVALDNGMQNIVLYLSEVNNDVQAMIPKMYKGFPVQFKVVGTVKPMTL